MSNIYQETPEENAALFAILDAGATEVNMILDAGVWHAGARTPEHPDGEIGFGLDTEEALIELAERVQ